MHRGVTLHFITCSLQAHDGKKGVVANPLLTNFPGPVLLVPPIGHSFHDCFPSARRREAANLLGNRWHNQDRVLLRLRSHVVYCFTCWSFEASYVGETCRHLHTRVSEHMGISPVTGKKRSNLLLTSILSHHQDTNHLVSFKDFNIVSYSSFDCELLLHESLLISKLKLPLNANIGSTPLLLL